MTYNIGTKYYCSPEQEMTSKYTNKSDLFSLGIIIFEMFIAILSLGKLMRNDYLISAHLAHMICMNSLVEQMVDRDIQYNTNFHRYGYMESLNYYNTYNSTKNKYCNSKNNEYNHISKLLIS